MDDRRIRAAIWIDHREARIFRFSAESFTVETLAAPTHPIRKHPRGAAEPARHPGDARRFFRDVARALAGVDEVLIVGPSTAKLHLIRYLERHAHALEARIVGVETVDHPRSSGIARYARGYFATPRWLPRPSPPRGSPRGSPRGHESSADTPNVSRP